MDARLRLFITNFYYFIEYIISYIISTIFKLFFRKRVFLCENIRDLYYTACVLNSDHYHVFYNTCNNHIDMIILEPVKQADKISITKQELFVYIFILEEADIFGNIDLNVILQLDNLKYFDMNYVVFHNIVQQICKNEGNLYNLVQDYVDLDSLVNTSF